jgi:hypothetical protein
MSRQHLTSSHSYSSQVLRLLLVEQASMLPALAGCSDSDDPPPPPPVEGVISGNLPIG